MKAWIRLLIAVVVLAVVVGVLYWPSKPAPAAAPLTPLVKVNPSQVQRITIDQPGQPEEQLVRQGNDWDLVTPYKFPADSNVVSDMLGSLGDITGAEDVGQISNPAAFGLDHPSTVELGLSNGATEQFVFGSDTPAGGNTYLRIGANGPVKTATAAVKTSALRSPFELQDKSLVHFPGGQVTTIDVTSGRKSVHVVKVNGQWPQGQMNNAEALLDGLQAAEMSSMEDLSGKSSAAHGLTHPATTLHIAWTGGEAGLDIGAKKSAASYYARSSASPAIFTIDDYLVNDITSMLTPAPSPGAAGSDSSGTSGTDGSSSAKP